MLRKIHETFFTSPLRARDFWNENKSLFGSLFFSRGVSLANFFSALNACDCLCARRSVPVIVLRSVPANSLVAGRDAVGEAEKKREQAKLHLLSLCSMKLHDEWESGAFGCSWDFIDMRTPPNQFAFLLAASRWIPRHLLSISGFNWNGKLFFFYLLRHWH